MKPVSAAAAAAVLLLGMSLPARAQQVEVLPPAFSVPLHSVDDGSVREQRARPVPSRKRPVQVKPYRTLDPTGLEQRREYVRQHPEAVAPTMGFVGDGAAPAFTGSVLQQFEGLTNDDNAALISALVLPPDDNLAVGPSHVFQMVNSVGRITSKTGGSPSTFTLNTFFAVDAGFEEVDPRVIYDAVSGRWFATYLQFSVGTSSSSIILAVSTSSDPTGTFCRYRLGNPTVETFLQDFPMIGTSDDKVVVSYNGFSFSTGDFTGAGYYVVNKADLVACAGTIDVTRVAPDANAFTIHPAQSLGSTNNLSMVAVGFTGTSVTVYTVSGVPGVSTVTTTSTVLSIRPGTAPPQAAQSGSGQLLETGDGRIETAVWQNNSLWAAASEACTPSGDSAPRSCLRVGEVRTDTMTLRQDLTYGASGLYYSFPALRPDASGNLHVVFSSSSSSTFMSVRVTGRLAGDALDTLQASTVLRAGSGAQTDASGRAGDYSGAAVDPADPSTVWVMGEYIRATADANWGTYVAQLQLANPAPAITSLSPSSATAGAAAFTLTVNGSGFAGSSVVRWNGADRTTTFVSGSQLTAAIPASDVASAALATVTVLTPAPGGGTSSGATFTVNNPVPVLTSLSQSAVTAGGSAFTLSLFGSNFVAASSVLWDGVSRTPTFVSSGQLDLAVSAADIASGATVSLVVSNPAPGGGTSGSQTLTINNPAPALASLLPSSATAGGPAFTLTVNGTGFVPTSVVRWNGVDLVTTFGGATQLTAAVPAANIASAGTASVTVFNPTPAGGTSSAQTFTIDAATFALTVSVRGSAAGSVSSSPGGIACPATCAADFTSGEVVTLTATPGAGASFKEWSGACAGTALSCEVTMSAARSVTATFSQVFTDATLTAGSSVIKAVHVLELRAAIDTLRVQYGLAAATWTNALAAGSSVVRAVDVAELRTALDAAYVAAGQTAPTYTDSTLTAGVTVVKASHVAEPRAAVRAIE